MKKRIGLILCLLVISVCAFALADDVAIDEAHFPDPVFREYVLSHYDRDKNGILSDEEASSVTLIWQNGYEFPIKITSMAGAEYFPNLTELYCDENQITVFDISHIPTLTHFDCSENKISELDVTKNPSLIQISCYLNQIKELDVSHNLDLVYLYCAANNLSSLDVSMLPKLKTLQCGSNGFTSLDISHNPLLEELYCNNLNLKELDIRNNRELRIVNCRDNQITTLDISNCKMLCEMVKGSSPFMNDKGYYGWIIDRDQDGNKDGYLYVDENIKVLIDGKNYNPSAKSDSVSSVALNKATATLTRSSKEKKPTVQLVATTAPAGAEVEWFSSDPKVATVDGNGLVTALDKGSVVITCKAKDNPGIKAECKITVSDKLITKIGLNQKKYTLKKGKTLVLKVKTLKPADALTQKFTWTTSNKKVATVDKNGKVKAKGKGTCTITCLAKDGSGKKATCKIIVK